MKRLVLFLVLWFGAANAMQSNVAQDQMDFTVTPANQSLGLTPEEHQQAVTQATENVKKIVDACGDNKDLLKKTLIQRVGSLVKTVFVDDIIKHGIQFTHGSIGLLFMFFELAITVTVLYSCVYGISSLVALAIGKNILLISSPAQVYWFVVEKLMYFGSIVGLPSLCTYLTESIQTGSVAMIMPVLFTIEAGAILCIKVAANLLGCRVCKKANDMAVPTI